jgi:hypothetical protein
MSCHRSVSHLTLNLRECLNRLEFNLQVQIWILLLLSVYFLYWLSSCKSSVFCTGRDLTLGKNPTIYVMKLV